MLLSIICPVYNEINYIGKVVEFFNSCPVREKEIFFVDGGSLDGTKEILKDISRDSSNIHYLENKGKYVSFALNMAIPLCKGKYIARIDSHTFYPSNYFKACIEISIKTGADNVGGYIVSIGKGAIGMANAAAMSSMFGVGDSNFRVKKQSGYVETVPFGFWKREIFEKIGVFDEELIRNQDDEFNYRTIRNGGKIFLSKNIHSTYYVRDSFSLLFKQYYQYGLFKPLVIFKVNKIVKIRHLVPFIFMLYCMILPLCVYNYYLAIPLLVYISMAIFFTFKAKIPLRSKIFIPVSFFVIHFSYGLGFFLGIEKVICRTLSKKRIASNK